eukprot:GHUV01004625.1.p1 GENE.GHUV01004625.1~~GHUV01004625.1.p1  ORF type:complete len:311 (+),score=87.64 GHUV01004625.1:204-1136(+)
MAGVQKSLERIQAQVQAGAFYEAQQMYKTVYHRCKARKQTADSYEVLKSGSVQQLSYQEITCGMELANMLLEAFHADKVPASNEYLGMIYAILQALPKQLQLAEPDSTAEVDECSRFVNAVLKWAHKQGADDAARKMHDMFADWIWQTCGWKQFGKAALHYSRGTDAAAYAAALAAMNTQAGGHEAHLFVTRAVLQTLASAHAANADRQLQYATEVLAACKQQQSQELNSQPLIHFCDMLLQALSMHKHNLMVLLRSRYEPSLAVDASFEAYLTNIEQVYFDVRPSGGSGGGLLGGLLRGLLEGDEMEED